jgi:hypothetical protein
MIEIGLEAFENNSFKGENVFIYSRDINGNVDNSYLVLYYNSEYYLDTLVIPSTVKKIGNNAFSYIEVNELIVSYGVEEIGDFAFENVYFNELRSLPKSLKKIGENVFNYNFYNYDDNDGFIYAHNEDGSIDKTVVMAYAGVFGEQSVVLPEGVVEIGGGVFNNYINSYIESINLPSTLEKIGNNAFSGTVIKEISIPSNVKYIGDGAFDIPSDPVRILVLDKSGINDFEYVGDNAFGNSIVVYEDRVEVTDISLNKTELSLFVGDSDMLVVTINPEDATEQNVIWSTSNGDVVTVDNGYVSAIGEGTATISAMVDGKVVSCNITVSKKITYSIEWEKIESSIADEYYLYIVSSEGEKVLGNVNIKYINDKDKIHEVPVTGLKLVKTAVYAVEIIETN